MLLATLSLSIDQTGKPLQAVTVHQRAHSAADLAPFCVWFPTGHGNEVRCEDFATVEEAFTAARATYEALILITLRNVRQQIDPPKQFATSAEAIAASKERLRRLTKIGGSQWANRVVYGSAA